MSTKNDKYSKVLFSLHWLYSVLLGLLWFYSVNFGHIWSTLALFCLLHSYSVHIDPIWSILFTLVNFNWVIQSTLVLFGPFYQFWFYLVHIGPFCPLQSYSIQFGHIRSYMFLFGSLCPLCPNLSIRSYSVLFNPHRSYSVHNGSLSYSVLCCPIWSTLFPFGSILCIRSTMFHLIQFDPFVSTLVPSNHFNPIWSILVNFCVLTYGEKACLD